MPLGLASNEGLGLARRATAWTCDDFAPSGAPHGAFRLRAREGGAARIRAPSTVDFADAPLLATAAERAD